MAVHSCTKPPTLDFPKGDALQLKIWPRPHDFWISACEAADILLRRVKQCCRAYWWKPRTSSPGSGLSSPRERDSKSSGALALVAPQLPYTNC